MNGYVVVARMKGYCGLPARYDTWTYYACHPRSVGDWEKPFSNRWAWTPKPPLYPLHGFLNSPHIFSSAGNAWGVARKIGGVVIPVKEIL